MIRNARMDDIKPIYHLLNQFAAKGLLLGRSLSSLYDQVRDFKVYESEDRAEDSSKVIGVCALHVCWENLAEIRSLAIEEGHQCKGIGRALVNDCLAEAKGLGIEKIFALTYQPEFFGKLGFRRIDKNELPHKVWSDCIHCPKFPDCNEEAMVFEHGCLL